MKKLSILALALILVLSLVACGGKGGGNSPSGSYVPKDNDIPATITFSGKNVTFVVNYGEMEEFAEIKAMGVDMKGTLEIKGTFSVDGDAITFVFDPDAFAASARKMMTELYNAMGVSEYMDQATLNELIDEAVNDMDTDEFVGGEARFDKSKNQIIFEGDLVFVKK